MPDDTLDSSLQAVRTYSSVGSGRTLLALVGALAPIDLRRLVFGFGALHWAHR
jgi:hypothetical protein